MDDLQPYYTPTGLQALELIDYYMAELLASKQSGEKVVEYREKMKVLKDLQKLFLKRAKNRKDLTEREEEEKETLLFQRTQIICPACNKKVKATIKENKKAIFVNTELQFDSLCCPHCHHEFMAEVPNNRADMEKYYDQLILMMNDILGNKVERGVSVQDEKDIKAVIKESERQRDLNRRMMDHMQECYQVMESIDNDEKEICNMLQIAKITGTMWEGYESIQN
jgi:hypothetical protein